MPRPIRATISAGALAHNLNLRREGHASGAKLWAVLKANAYGHGAASARRARWPQPTATRCSTSRRRCGCAPPASTSRSSCSRGSSSRGDLPLLAKYRLTPVIHNAEQVEMLRLAELSGEIDVYLKVNSGMNRLGFMVDNLRPAYNALRLHPQVRNVTLMTHFADADGAGGIKAQLDWFNELTKPFEPRQRSLANSAALVRFPEARGDWVRPGIMLYGCSPFGGTSASEAPSLLA